MAHMAHHMAEFEDQELRSADILAARAKLAEWGGFLTSALRYGAWPEMMRTHAQRAFVHHFAIIFSALAMEEGSEIPPPPPVESKESGLPSLPLRFTKDRGRAALA